MPKHKETKAPFLRDFSNKFNVWIVINDNNEIVTDDARKILNPSASEEDISGDKNWMLSSFVTCFLS